MKLRLRCFTYMLTAAVLSATAVPAQQEHAGSAACASCHKSVVEGLAAHPHGWRGPANHGAAVPCESCHGPGEAHARHGSVALIFDPAHALANDLNAKCLQCHEAARPHYQQSVHGVRNISCLGCHVMHSPAASANLLKSPQPELCIQCHEDVKAQFAAPFHHKVQEGLVNCTDCHDAHAAADDQPSAKSELVMCTKCHASIAGPFLYEHAPVKGEGCTACHFPHGSPNPKLLMTARVNTLCLQCHFPSTASAPSMPAVAEHMQSEKSQSCVSCHVAIHGSDISPALLDGMAKRSER